MVKDFYSGILRYISSVAFVAPFSFPPFCLFCGVFDLKYARMDILGHITYPHYSQHIIVLRKYLMLLNNEK